MYWISIFKIWPETDLYPKIWQKIIAPTYYC